MFAIVVGQIKPGAIFFFSSSLSEARSSPNVSPLGSDPASLEALAGALTMNMRSRCLGRCQAVLLVHALLPAVRTQGCSVGSCWDSRGAGAGLGPSQVHFQQQRQMLGLQWDQCPSVCWHSCLCSLCMLNLENSPAGSEAALCQAWGSVAGRCLGSEQCGQVTRHCSEYGWAHLHSLPPAVLPVWDPVCWRHLHVELLPSAPTSLVSEIDTLLIIKKSTYSTGVLWLQQMPILFSPLNKRLDIIALPCYQLFCSVSSLGNGAVHPSSGAFPGGRYYKCSYFDRGQGSL